MNEQKWFIGISKTKGGTRSRIREGRPEQKISCQWKCTPQQCFSQKFILNGMYPRKLKTWIQDKDICIYIEGCKSSGFPRIEVKVSLRLIQNHIMVRENCLSQQCYALLASRHTEISGNECADVLANIASAVKIIELGHQHLASEKAWEKVDQYLRFMDEQTLTSYRF